MPASAQKLAAMRSYEQTPAGKAARKRSQANFIQRRREQKAGTWAPPMRPMSIDKAIQQNWR